MTKPDQRSVGQIPVLASFLLGFAALGVPGAPAGTADRELPCRYFYFKEPIELELDADRVAVQYRTAVPAAEGKRLSAEAGVLVSRLRSAGAPRWNVLSLELPGVDSAGIDQRVAALSRSAGVEFASPVFQGASGLLTIVTQDVLLRFVAQHAERGGALLAELAPELEVVAANFGGMSGAYHLRSVARNGFDVLALANRLAQDPRVAWAVPNMLRQFTVGYEPNDPHYTNGDLWGIHNYGQDGGVADMDMDGPEAWDTTFGDAAIQVLILDSGVQQDHPDINQNPGADFTGLGGGGGPVYSYEKHGTAVAGCVSAIIDNTIGVVGIAPHCKVLSAKYSVHDDPGPTGWFQIEWLANALEWGVSEGARCSVSSFGIEDPDPAIDSAYDSARAAGMLNFASSGNDGVATVGYPASLSSVTAIGGIRRTGARIYNYGTGLAFTGPAKEIWTTDRTGSDGYSGGDYVEVDGTSFSCPYAAGVAALALAQYPFLTADEVEAMMQSTAKDLGDTGYDTEFGWGIVNADNFDCNNNGIRDEIDIAGSTSEDCNSNAMPDECEAQDDCQPNGFLDFCDLYAGTSEDCNADEIPDDCQLAGNDCNTNSTPDDCELPGNDCNLNGTLDECDIDGGTSHDCQPNGTPDECEDDCNVNGIADECDVNAATSPDCNTNGRPDECEIMRCMSLWDGFQPNPPFSRNTPIDTIDYIPQPDGDGVYWTNPEQTGIIDRRGCETGLSSDHAVKVSVDEGLADPQDGYVASEYFQAYDGGFAPDELVYDLSFRAKIGLGIDSDWDWEFFIYDAVREQPVVQLEFTSYESLKVPQEDRGYILVKNPAGPPEYFNTTVPILLDTCVNIEVAMDNRVDTVIVYVDDAAPVVTTRLNQNALRMDYFRLHPVDNMASGISSTEFKVDYFELCLIGQGVPIEEIPDCNENDVWDDCDIADGTSEDCNSNGIPDECGMLDLGDFDGDGDVDLTDYQAFQGCFTGMCTAPPCEPALYSGPCCVIGDTNNDGDIDLGDFRGFQAAFTD